ncbi:DUF5063 domain-containing protein [Sanguibacter sp. HDW7]|uniref:DUF5063 domain-containing protein n=1 Tax=Sanguibacter sp. HDW7 TaxID=2714931 RepID=UPI001F0D18E3|nr:DUF5063 domain-containing protein [Sanguibacter sp. HDW7]
MADDVRMTLPGGVTEVGAAFAEQASNFVATVTHVASGATPEAAIPVLLLATTDVLASGSRLGAMVDVVPAEEFEPDSGPDTDVEPLRVALALILDGLDSYPEVVDPVLGAELDTTSLSDGLAEITLALTQGLAHHEAGHPAEALWWWQFSYLSGWGATAASAARVLASILGHLRLDVDDDVAAEAEYDALQRHTTG